MKELRIALAVFLWLCAGCGERGAGSRMRRLRVFHASGLTPVLEAVREDTARELRLTLLNEASGSQVACRKVSELGRDCDLIMVADNRLVKTLLSGRCSWRIDFARDEVVLAVGARAPAANRAEEDWVSVLTQEGVRLGRVDENQGPIGYRTLLVWKLQEQLGSRGLYETLLGRCTKVVDHVTRLTPLLKTGEIDYAFVYRSICVARDIRFIELDPRINLGADDVDYSGARVTFERLKSGERQMVTISGAPITWALSAPDAGADVEAAREFVRYLLVQRADVLARNGFRPLAKAQYYGPARLYQPFEATAERGGDLE